MTKMCPKLKSRLKSRTAVHLFQQVIQIKQTNKRNKTERRKKAQKFTHWSNGWQFKVTTRWYNKRAIINVLGAQSVINESSAMGVKERRGVHVCPTLQQPCNYERKLWRSAEQPPSFGLAFFKKTIFRLFFSFFFFPLFISPSLSPSCFTCNTCCCCYITSSWHGWRRR